MNALVLYFDGKCPFCAAEMQRLLRKAAEVIPAGQLWVNPDCGLKTRGWPETEAALRHMVDAARALRGEGA